MDIFKILSRGTKPARSFKGVLSPAGTLPSAGAKPNPQLFRHGPGPDPPPRGQKRKRDDHSHDQQRQQQPQPPAPDKFRPDGDDQVPEYTSAAPSGHAPTVPPSDDPPSEPAMPAAARDDQTSTAGTEQKLGEDECRRIFKSHRLKITLLSPDPDGLPPPPQAETPKKRDKKKLKPTAPELTRKDLKRRRRVFSQPLTSFDQLRSVYRISPRVADNLARQSYRLPTEVQMASLPLLLRPEEALTRADGALALALEQSGGGVDFIAVAPTGSGKTISYLVPAINGILRRRSERRVRGPRALEAIVVAPTRELAFQIATEGRRLASGVGVAIMPMRKGMRLAVGEVRDADAGEDDMESESSDAREQDGQEKSTDDESEDESAAADENEDENAAEQEDDESGGEDGQEAGEKKKRPAPLAKIDILVTTPLLLLNFLTAGLPPGRGRSLPTVELLVLDEADALLDPLFRDQTVGIWDACTNPSLRLSLWSATMGASIESLVTERLSSRPRPAPVLRLVVGLKDTAVPNVAHRLIFTSSEQGKLLALRQLLRPGSSSGGATASLRPPFLVFTQTIERASSLHAELKYDIPPEAGGSARIASLHGGLSESARALVMRRFRAGEIWVLITTDVLARGIDFAGVNGVVSYDVPGSAAAYVHRAGRTGRAGREGGVAVTLYTRDDLRVVKTFANAVAASEGQVGGGALQPWLLDGLARVTKEDRKRLKERGVETRRSGARGAQITTKSGWERQRESNLRGAIEASRRRKREGGGAERGGGAGKRETGAKADPRERGGKAETRERGGKEETGGRWGGENEGEWGGFED